MSGSKVLCYAPYNRWALHGLLEMTILQALVVRGAAVKYVMCDGLYTDCDVYWEALTGPRPHNACAGCQADQARLAASMGMNFEWLGRYLTLEEQAEAREWANGLSDEQLPEARHGEWMLADWMRSSVQSHFRSSELDLGDPGVVRVLRSYLYSGLLACYGLSRLLDASDPDVLLLFNGRISSTRVAFELARARGIRVLVHERGPRDETLQLQENVTTTSLAPAREYWQQWGGVPLLLGELDTISQLFAEREHGRNTGWTSYTTLPQDAETVLQKLGLDRDRPVWALFTSSDEEVAGDEDYRSPFSSQLAWIEQTIDYAREHPEIDLVIRVHPNTGSRRSHGANRIQLEQMRRLIPRLPENARLIDPDDELSSYTLMDVCAVGLVWVSTVAIEMAVKGKEVVVAAGNYVSDTPFTHTVHDAALYSEMLDCLLATEPGARSAQTRRLALRLAYGLWFRMRIAFPLVKMPNPHEGVLAYNSLEALLPGRDASVDRCARIVLEGEPVCPPPTAVERGRDTADEDAFLVGFGEPPVGERASVEIAADEPVWELRASTPRQCAEPRVSVVIPCYNAAPYLKETVASVLAQTLDDIEILIVDDGSSDASVEAAESLIAAHADASITLWCQRGEGRPSGNPARPRNAGVQRSRAGFVLCLDADDLLTPTFLERCVETLEANPSAGVAYTDLVPFRSDGHWTIDQAAEYDLDVLSHRNLIPIASLFRRSAWEEVGGFDPDIVYEDWDFWIGCGYAGHHPMKVADARWLYRLSDTGRYQTQCIPADRISKAKMVRKRPELYSDAQRLWADAALAGARWAQQLDDELGVIPKLPMGRVATRGAMPSAEAGQLRAFVTLAWATEVVATPSLLTAYADVFGPDADATLVLYAPSGEQEDLPEQVVALVQAAGLDGDDGPDMHLLAVPAADGEPFLLDHANAVLSDRPVVPAFADLPHIGEAEVVVLAQLARIHGVAGEPLPALAAPL